MLMRQVLALVPCLVVGLVLTGCAAALNWQNTDYTVKKGDTLYSIAWRYDLDYHTLAAWNHILPPYRIFPGQKLYLKHAKPVHANRSYASVSSSSSASSAPVKKTIPKKKTASASSTAKHRSSKPTQSSKKVAGWQWPAQGKVVSTFDPDKVAAKGINIRGHVGASVVAAAAGQVVYSGDGLPGYGELIIIKHNRHFLSAYAHNKKRLVKEGSTVAAGDKIATMGKGGDGKPVLHFEVRYDGKPVNPLKYLPKK